MSPETQGASEGNIHARRSKRGRQDRKQPNSDQFQVRSAREIETHRTIMSERSSSTAKPQGANGLRACRQEMKPVRSGEARDLAFAKLAFQTAVGGQHPFLCSSSTDNWRNHAVRRLWT